MHVSDDLVSRFSAHVAVVLRLSPNMRWIASASAQ